MLMSLVNNFLLRLHLLLLYSSSSSFYFFSLLLLFLIGINSLPPRPHPRRPPPPPSPPYPPLLPHHFHFCLVLGWFRYGLGMFRAIDASDSAYYTILYLCVVEGGNGVMGRNLKSSMS